MDMMTSAPGTPVLHTLHTFNTLLHFFYTLQPRVKCWTHWNQRDCGRFWLTLLHFSYLSGALPFLQPRAKCWTPWNDAVFSTFSSLSRAVES